MTIQVYITHFSSCVDQLAEVGVELQEELFAIMLLVCQPTSYENLVVALEARDSLPSLSSLKIKLLEEGERRNGQTEENTNAHVFASRSDKENKVRGSRNRVYDQARESQNQKKRIKCFK